MSAARAPVAPKTQAAAFGAGTGAAMAAVIVGLVQTYVTHKMLPPSAVQAIYGAVPVLLAFFAAWLAPHQQRPGDPPGLMPGEVFTRPGTAAAGYAGPAPRRGGGQQAVTGPPPSGPVPPPPPTGRPSLPPPPAGTS